MTTSNLVQTVDGTSAKASSNGVASAPPSIGPGSIAQPSTTGGPAFALSAAEWLAIQVYVNDALALPITMPALKATLGAGAPADMSDFTQLVAAYAAINCHVNTWQTATFPASVSLASDIYNYAQQVPIYYNPILPLAQQLVTSPDDATAKQQLSAILGVLASDAKTNHDKAAAVAAQIQAFADDTQKDKVTLSGPDGKTGLQKYYTDKYGTASDEVTAITKELKDAKAALDSDNAEYNHDVIVAATTPTYAWILPFGTIAGAVVAGVYGQRAVNALDRAHADQQKIDDFSAELAAAANLVIALNNADAGISNILGPLTTALPIIQKIQGVWGAISDDLNNIISLIATNIAAVPPIIMNLGVQTAIDDWTRVGAEANAYRLNAYISVPR